MRANPQGGADAAGAVGGIVSLQNLETAMQEGFEFVAMGRALIADPDLIDCMRRGEVTRSRCTACNKCVAEMDRNGCAASSTTETSRHTKVRRSRWSHLSYDV